MRVSPENRNLGRVHDGGECGSADAAEIGDRHGGSPHLFGADLPRLRARGQIGYVRRDPPQALDVGVADHGNHQPVRRVDGDADMHIAFDDQRPAVGRQRGVEARKFREAARQRLHVESQRRQLHAARRGFLRQRLAERLDAPHVGPIVMRDLRDQGVRGRQVRGGDLRHARHRLLRDEAELAMIHVPIPAVIRPGGGGQAIARQAPVDVVARQRRAARSGGEGAEIDALLSGVGPHGGARDKAHCALLTNWPRCIGFP